MNKNIEAFIKDCFIFILIPIFVLGAGGYFSWVEIDKYISTSNNLADQKEKLKNKSIELKRLLEEKERAKREQEKPKQEEVKKEPKSGKVIYEVLGQQFSAEASFGIMFENIISNITNSGVKIRSIEYNYFPQDDKVLSANAPGYNACELSFVAVGSYSQLQSFFKNITKEKYLTNIKEIYIEPYDKNKTILIAKFKIRLYTKTVV